MSLEAWKAFFEVGGVVLLALTFIFGAGALIVNNHLNVIQARELRDFRLKFASEQQKTALAQKEAEEAKQLANGFERDIATANQKAAEAREKSESEKLARVQLERQLSPRRLTGEQIATLTKLLKPKPSVIVIVSALVDGESADFASDFDSAFKAAGWKTFRYANRITSARGMELGTVAGTNDGGAVAEVETILQNVGVEVKPTTFSADDHSTSPWFEKKVLYLVINHKPEISTKS